MSLTKVQINLGTSGNLSGSRSLASSSLASRITTAEDELGNTLISSSAQLADDISGSFGSQRVGTSDSPTFNAITVGTATVTGTLTAQEVHTEFESASILFTSGSTQFGNSTDDVHEFKGNVISGSSTSTASLAMISLADKIEHIGDTNNTIEFGTDEIKLRTGGGSRLIARDSNVELYNDLVVAGAATFNEDSGDKDFRIESNDNTHMFFVDGGQNRIGIGVGASPAFATLDIDAPGATNADNLDQSVDRATLRVRYRTDETDDGMFFGGLGSSAGYIQGVIDASDDNSSQAGKTIAINPYGGNVGIGTNNPGAILDVDSGAIGESDSEACGIRVTLQRNGSAQGLTLRHEDASGGSTDASEGTSIQFQGYDGSNSYHNLAAIFGRADGESVSDSDSPGFLTFHTTPDGSDSFSERMRITKGGFVGIGTDNPVQPLHIHQASNSQMQFTDNASGAATADGLRVGWNGSLGQVYLFEDADLRFATNNTERMRITSAGRVGVGFTAPETTLQVSGSIGSKLGGGGFISIIRKHASITAGDLLGAVRFGGEETDQQVGGTVQAKCDGVWQTNDLPTRLEFLTTPDGAGDQVLRMTIKNTGKVGIGTDAPDGQLDVVTDGGVAQLRVKSIGSGDDCIIDV